MRTLTLFTPLWLVLPSLAVADNLSVSYAEVAAVKSTTPIYQQVNRPRQECWTEEVTATVPSEHDYGGTILGGITGAILGAQIGKGGGRDAAIAIGAATGAVVGDQAGNKDTPDTVSKTRSERHCRYLDNWTQEISGYRVVYRFDGRDYKVELPYDPGPGVQLSVTIRPTGPAPRSGAGVPPPPPPRDLRQ